MYLSLTFVLNGILIIFELITYVTSPNDGAVLVRRMEICFLSRFQ